MAYSQEEINLILGIYSPSLGRIKDARTMLEKRGFKCCEETVRKLWGEFNLPFFTPTDYLLIKANQHIKGGERDPYKLALKTRLDLEEYFPDYTISVEVIKKIMKEKKIEFKTEKAPQYQNKRRTIMPPLMAGRKPLKKYAFFMDPNAIS